MAKMHPRKLVAAAMGEMDRENAGEMEGGAAESGSLIEPDSAQDHCLAPVYEQVVVDKKGLSCDRPFFVSNYLETLFSKSSFSGCCALKQKYYS